MLKIKPDDVKQMYKKMLEIRYFEERVIDLYKKSIMPGLAHLYIGEEAVAVGTCMALKKDDYITSTHRGHGHLIAKGGELKPMMAEILGKKTGYCRGKGGSMHIADFDLGILGANGIVGGGFGTAIGAGLTSKMLKQDRVSVCFFGDGSSNEGSFHECVNLAGIWKLPVVFVCENNGYGISVSQARHQAITNIADRAVGYGMPGFVTDGMDVLAVYEKVLQAVKRARQGEGPTLVECKTYRYNGHHVGDPGYGAIYRTQEEMDMWKKKDAIERLKKYMLEKRMMEQEVIDAIEEETKKLVDEATEFAINSPYPKPEELFTDLYA
ncbi:MAG: thiamine pyrophosphate-dependent dehydrogenase E1 component subunit alpha [Dehalobacterium sp.]